MWYHAALHRAAHPRAVLAAALLTACGAGPAADYYPGASSASRGGGTGPRAAAPAKRPAPLWPAFDKVKRWPALGAPRPAPDHGGGRYLGAVRVSPDARKTYLQLTRGAELPVGSIVAMFHEKAQGHAPGPVYVMRKQTAGWQYLVLSPEGRIRDQGRLGLCERCHAEATADHLFGPPVDSGAK